MNYAQLLIPDFSLIFCGYLVCRYTRLNRTVWEQVDALVYYVLFPVLLFYSVVKSPFDLSSTSNLIIAGWSMCLSGIALAYSLPYWPVLKQRIQPRQHAACAQVAFRFNTFIALGMADRLAGPSGVLLIAVLVGVCVPLLNIAAVWPMVRQSKTGFLFELIRNPLIIATALGLICNMMGVRLPDWITPVFSRMGGASLALGLMAAGAGLQLSALGKDKLLATGVLGIRHLCMPLIAWAFANVFELSSSQTLILLIFSGVPTAASGYVLAARMGYDGAYVAALITISTLLGMLSLPFALSLANS